MIVDIHGHFGQGTPASRVGTYAGVCGLQYVLLSNLDAASVPDDAPNLDEGAANIACLEACQSHPRLKPLYWVRPGKPDSNLHALAGALATEPFVGVVFAPEENGYNIDDPFVDAYADVLAQRRRPALVLFGPDDCGDPRRVYKLAQRHTDLPFVMCACGAGPEQRDHAVEVLRQSLEAGLDNLYLDTAHATSESIVAAVQTVGAERVLFGTNALAYQDAHIPRHITVLEELRRMLSTEDQRRVLGGNAAGLFDLRAPGAR